METGPAHANPDNGPAGTAGRSGERHGSGFTPVFILGSGRSGSTLLYKMLCLHPEIAYISNWDAAFPDNPPCMLLGRLTRGWYRVNLWSWFDSRGHANDHDRPLFRKLVPTPVEGEPFYRHCGVPLTASEPPVDPETAARLRRAFERLARFKDSRIVLAKRTANLHRLNLLLAAFPEARFIGIVRDGRSVADSAVRAPWWLRPRVRFEKSRLPDPKTHREEALRVAANAWVRHMAMFEEAQQRIGPGRFRLVVYEQLLDDWAATLHPLLRFCGVSEDEEYFRALGNVSLLNREAWRSSWPETLQREITELQRPVLERYGYRP